MLDEWNHGLMKKSAEAKIKIFENSSKKYSLGGAGNLCSNLKSLGINFKFYSEVGTDMNGKKIVHLLKNKNNL